MRATTHLLLLLAIGLAACEDGPASSGLPGGSEDGKPGEDDPTGGDGDTTDGESVDPALAARQIDYNEALRTASLKLTRRTPTLAQIRRVETAVDPKVAYEAELDLLLESPAFAARMLKFWQDTMRMGGPGLDTAPALAAKLTVEEGRLTDLFTLETGNCPTFDGETGTFTPADCASGAPAEAGVLTDPAVMRQFYGNMAFRRVRWVQETFFCSKMPAEIAETPLSMNGKDYTSPWVFESISASPIDFQDTQSVVCANCHSTMNHIAPLFGNFDADGMWQAGIAVMTPLAPEPVPTELSHWLVPGEATAWRLGQEAGDLPALGAVLAEEPGLSECLVARAWNWSMSKEDIVADLATVPYSVLEPYVLDFDVDRNFKQTLRSIMTSEDFVSF